MQKYKLILHKVKYKYVSQITGQNVEKDEREVKVTREILEH